MIFGIDGTVVCDFVHFFSFGADLGDCIFWCFLEQVDDAIHNIDEDYLGQGEWWFLGCPARAQRTSKPAKCIFSATKPRPMFPPPKWTAVFDMVAV